MTTAAVIFTCVRDARPAEIAARSLMHAGASVSLAIDAAEHSAFRSDFPKVATGFIRRGNLNGMACLRGILRTLRNVSVHAEWALKVDSDTLSLPAFHQALATTEAGAVGVQQAGRDWCGACYAIRTRHLPRLIDLADRYPDYPACPEDRFALHLIHQAGIPYARHPLGWWNNAENKGPQKPVAALTFGWMQNLPAEFDTPESRTAEIARRMEKFSESTLGIQVRPSASRKISMRVISPPPIRTNPEPAPRIKLALLFLTLQNVNRPGLWNDFIAEGGDAVVTFSHPKIHRNLPPGFVRDSAIARSVNTSWGDISLVRAMLALLDAAMRDTSVSHFAFVSESCIPVRSWLEISETLRCDPRSMLEVTDVTTMKPCHRVRHEQTDGTVPSTHWKHHPQWVLLHRDAATCVLSRDMTAAFEKVFAPDEHYFGTVLSLNGFPETSIRRMSPTWVDWLPRCPRVHSQITPALTDKWNAAGVFFARKFTPEHTPPQPPTEVS